MRFEFAILPLAVSLAGSALAAPYPADGIIVRRRVLWIFIVVSNVY